MGEFLNWKNKESFLKKSESIFEFHNQKQISTTHLEYDLFHSFVPCVEICLSGLNLFTHTDGKYTLMSISHKENPFSVDFQSTDADPLLCTNGPPAPNLLAFLNAWKSKPHKLDKK